MIEYMKEFLEKPHPVFGGLPICPFARKARLDGDILYKVDRFQLDTDLNPDSSVMRMIAEFCQQDRYKVLFVVHPDPQAMTPEEMQHFISYLNRKIATTDLVAFGGHPSDEFNVQGVRTRQEPYLNFTVQTKQLLTEAADSLSKTNYYDNWTPENLKYVGIPRTN